MKPAVARAIFITAILSALASARQSDAQTVSAPTPAAPSAAASSAPAANRFAATIAPAERFEVRGVLVERHGSGGRPLILIPGLMSGSWVWQDTIRAFSKDHAIYVLTLPGFDGRPAAGADAFANARAAVEELIASRKLAKPVIVGHSIGGTLGIAVAEDRPDVIGGLVSIDGLAVFPGTEDLPPGARPAAAERIRASMASARGDAFAGQQQSYMRTIGVLDMDMAGELAKLTARSDPVSSARYAADVVALDLRPGLKTITAPVLVIAPFYDQDGASQGIGEKDKAGYYARLMEGTPKLQVLPVAPARHFAMFDEPQKINDAIASFLKTL
ncbi:alpha/beta fold hydrolase [Massilia sp. 9096]|uniref:alpha/beta fold hydrolase n=1 Tax=Massilia sp. 9096 TaxID=1500894 RepID=UPI00055AEF52|nr:alpha/beta hydrolase [Massilia sp. 9096]